MTVCRNKLGGVCGACTLVNICRNNEIANLPKSNIEWMREASLEELAEWLFQHCDCIGCPANREICRKQYGDCKTAFLEWLQEVHHDNP